MFRDKLLNQSFLASLLINSLTVCAVGHAQLARQVALLTGDAAPTSSTRIAALHPIRVGIYHPPVLPKLVAAASGKHPGSGAPTPATQTPDGATSALGNSPSSQALAAGTPGGDGGSSSSSNGDTRGGADASLNQAARLASQAMSNDGHEGARDENHTGDASSRSESGSASGSSRNSSDGTGHAGSGRSRHQDGSHTGSSNGSHDGWAGHGVLDNSAKSTGAIVAARLALLDGNAAATHDTTDASDSASAEQAERQAADNPAATQSSNSTTASADAHRRSTSDQKAHADISPTAQKATLAAGIGAANNASTVTKAGVSLRKDSNHPARAHTDATAARQPSESQPTGLETPSSTIKVVTSDVAQDNAAEAALEHEMEAGEQSPEKGLGPTTYVVPKVAKMWTIPPDQKFVLPTDLKLALPADMPVVPGIKPLTREQIEQLRQLLHQHNLQHMQGLTREQLKKLLEARKNAERPTSDQTSTNPTAELPDQPDDTLKPRRPARPRLAAADDAPVLPPGLTSPFKYKPWSPAWRERYAMFVQQTPMDNTLVDPATDLLPQPTAPFAANPADATPTRPPLLAALPDGANSATSAATAPIPHQTGANAQSTGDAQPPTGGQGASATSPSPGRSNPTHGSGAEALAANTPATGDDHPGAALLGAGQPGATAPATAPNTTAPSATGTAGPTQPTAPTNNGQTAGSATPNTGATAPNPGVLGSGNAPSTTGQTNSGQGPANPAPGGDGQANAGQPNIAQPNAGQSGTGATNNNQAGVLGSGQPGHDAPAAGQHLQPGTGAGQPGTGQAGATQPGAAQTGTGQQGAGQQGTSQTGAGQPNTAQTNNGVLGSGTGQAAGQPATGTAGTGASGNAAGQTGSPGTGQANTGQANAGVLGSGTTQSGTGQAGTPPGTGLLGSGTNQAGSNQANTGAPGTGQQGTGVLGAGQSGTGQQNTGPAGTGVLGAGTPGTGAAGNPAPGNVAPGVLGTGAAGTGAQGTAAPGVLGAGQNGTGSGTATPPGTGPADATAAGGDFGSENQGDMGGEAFVDNEGIAGDEPTTEAVNPDAAGFTPAEGVQPNMPPHTHDQQKGIPGALVLPPLPPLGAEAGTNPIPRTVKPVLRLASAVPPRFQTPPPGAPAPATTARPRASQAREAMAAQDGGEKPRRPVPEPVSPKPASAPQTASPRPVPPTISFGSTSENGTILMPVTKNPLILGLVPATDLTAHATVVRAPAPHPGRAANRSVRPVTATAPPAQRKLGVEGQATAPQASNQLLQTKPTLAHRAMGQATPVERSDDATVPEALPHKQSKNSQGIKEGSKNPLPPTPLPDSDAEIGDGSGLKGEYYLGRNLDQYQFTRADPNIDFIWATESNSSPNPRLPQGSDYSARWTGKIQPRYSETYTIYGVADDGIRVWVDHKLLIDAWAIHGVLEYSGKIQLEAGKQYDIRVDYFEANAGGAAVGVYWESQSQKKEFIPEECLFYPLAGDKEALELDEKPHLVPIDKY